jgi:hypothetical protein
MINSNKYVMQPRAEFTHLTMMHINYTREYSGDSLVTEGCVRIIVIIVFTLPGIRYAWGVGGLRSLGGGSRERQERYFRLMFHPPRCVCPEKEPLSTFNNDDGGSGRVYLAERTFRGWVEDWRRWRWL